MKKTINTFGALCFSVGITHSALAEIPAESCKTEVSFTSFNAQVFGQSKVEKTGYLDLLAEEIRNHDLFLLQEIRDSSNTAIYKLWEKLPEYSLVLSERTGRSVSQEQQALFYKKGDVQSHSSQGNIEDFERLPWEVQMIIGETRLKILASHTKPTDADKEVVKLTAFVDNEQANVIVGDLNADCSYFSDAKKEKFKTQFPHLQWFIPDDADTTTGPTHCAYDRFVGNQLFGNIVITGSSKVIGKNIHSDHFPITTKICTEKKED